MSVLFVLVTTLARRGYALTDQVSESMPKGFYLVYPAQKITMGEVVVFHPPKFAADFLVSHHWLPNNHWMMKHVVATPGDFVCNAHDTLTVNHHAIAPLQQFDSHGERLPVHHFCRTLQPHQYLMVSTRVKNSYDGRYFGPVEREQIKGRALKL